MKKIYYMGLFVPLAAYSHHAHMPESQQFLLACMALIPVAYLLGEATEHLAEHAGPAIGGFLNATLGNATELIIGAIGIYKGGEAVEVIKASITGSILGNLLLILGLSMFFGGWGREKQRFSRDAVGAQNAMMTLAVAGLMLPSMAYLLIQAHKALEPAWTPPSFDVREYLTLWCAAILMLSYVLSLVFSFVTHSHLFDVGTADDAADDPEGKHEVWPMKTCVGVLLGATLVVAYLSEMLVHSVEAAGKAWGLSPTFIGLVVVATVGNAAEHASAILVAMKDKMELALSIALGSATQIALFMAPALVFFGYFIGKPLTLEFSIAEVMAVALAVNIGSLVSLDGESNWFEGFQLVSLYLMVAGFFYVMA